MDNSSTNSKNSAIIGKVGQQEKLFEDTTHQVKELGLQNQQPVQVQITNHNQYQMKTTGQIAEAQNQQGIYYLFLS